MPAGFVASRPGARFGNSYNGPYGTGYEFAFKFVCGGSGIFNATEIGIWFGQYNAFPPAAQMAIFTHDAANDCPDVIVANSQCSTIGGATPAWYYAALTNCQVTGGVTYWICWLEGGGTDAEDLSCLSGSGAGLFKTGLTPYTFSTGDDWHTHTNQTAWTPDVYVLIEAAGVIQPAAAYAVCNKINPLIGSDPYLLASIFRRFPSQEFEDYEFEDEQQSDSLYWVEDKPGLAADDIIDDFFEYSGIPEPLVILPAAINAVCSKVDPTIPFVTLFITPTALSAIASKNNPVIQLYITPVAANAISSRANPSILVTPALTVTPAAINAIARSINPSVIIPVMVVPAAIYAVAGRVNPIALMPLEVAPTPIYAVAGKLNPTLPILPSAIYAVADKFEPSVAIPSIPAYSIASGIDPQGVVTPPLVISFEMWRDSIPMSIDPYVIYNPLITTANPADAIVKVINPFVYILGGGEYVLPDAASAITIATGVEISAAAMQILELFSFISTQLELVSIIKTELNLDSDISQLLNLDSFIPERVSGVSEGISEMPGKFDVGKFDEEEFG